MPILLGLIVIIILYFILDFFFNFEIAEEICDLVKKIIYKHNPNRYFYKCFKKDHSIYGAFLSLSILFSISYYDSMFLFDPLTKRKKDIWLGVIRFSIGLTNTNFFEDKKKALIDTIYHLAIQESDAPNENFYENENIIINNFQILKATYKMSPISQMTNRYKNYTFVFKNKTTNKIFSVNMLDWDLEKAKDKFNFLFNQ